jgi:hypothetical protein
MKMMFGLSKRDPQSDKLTVQVHAIGSAEAYQLAAKIWNENVRTLHADAHGHKDFLHFAYANPKCVVWLQRDQNRTEPFELIVRWEANKTHEVFVISSAPANQPTGNDQRAKALLTSILTTPSIVLARDNR